MIFDTESSTAYQNGKAPGEHASLAACPGSYVNGVEFGSRTSTPTANDVP